MQETARKLLHESNYKERYFAAQKLHNQSLATILLCLLQATQDDNEWVRQAAINALASSGDPRVIPFIRDMFDDDHGDVSSTAKAAVADFEEKT